MFVYVRFFRLKIFVKRKCDKYLKSKSIIDVIILCSFFLDFILVELNNLNFTFVPCSHRILCTCGRELFLIIIVAVSAQNTL